MMQSVINTHQEKLRELSDGITNIFVETSFKYTFLATMTAFNLPVSLIQQMRSILFALTL